MNPDRKLRIMHLNSYIGYDGPSRGILGQVKYTDPDVFQCIIGEVKSTKHAALIAEIFGSGYEHISFNSDRIYDATVILKLVRYLRGGRIDLLNTHNAAACWYGNLAAKIAGVPVVFTLRNDQRENYKFLFGRMGLSGAAAFLDRLTMRAADKVVAVSSRLENVYIEREGVPAGKIMTIRNAIDLDALDQARAVQDREALRKEMGIGADVTVIGMVGDLVERKGHACLIEAARIFLKKGDPVLFLIVGDGPLKEDLLRRIGNHSLQEHFVFTGHVTNVFRSLSVMDLFVLPSYAEGLSRALMEAMAMGMPAVCSDNDGNLEALEDEKTGLLFPMGDHTVLAERLSFLIRNRDVRLQMGRQARLAAEKKFNMRHLARRYEALYRELIHAHR